MPLKIAGCVWKLVNATNLCNSILVTLCVLWFPIKAVSQYDFARTFITLLYQLYGHYFYISAVFVPFFSFFKIYLPMYLDTHTALFTLEELYC